MMRKRGFTLIEIIVVTTVVLTLGSIVLKSYSVFNSRASLGSDVSRVVSALNQARADTLLGKGGLQYGVHFDPDKAVLFQGAVYSSGASTNKSFNLNPRVSITSVNLVGGGNEVVFNKLSGATSNFGLINFSTSGIVVATSSIGISNNGIVTIQ